MPNDMMSQILEMMGIDSYSGEPKQRPMARRGRGGVNGAPQSESYEGDVPDPDNAAQMSRYAQEEASVPGDSATNYSGMSNTREFQEAVDIFISQTGREPATDSDFEMGVVPIMEALMYGADPGFDDEMLTVPDSILKQMGEEPDAEGNEELRRGR